ncbi:492_t:CDS:1, partial [Racocetra fulgida]
MEKKVKVQNPVFPSPRSPIPPVTVPPSVSKADTVVATLVLKDGSSYQGFSFGAESKSVAGECVFQTGNVIFIVNVSNVSQ